MKVYYAELCMDYMKQYVKSRIIYRADFYIEIASDFLNQLINLLFIVIVFTKVPALAGWKQDEIIFIYGYFLLPYSLFEAFWGNLWMVQDRYIIKGELDRVLVRPMHSLLQILLETMTLESLSGFVTGIAVLLYSAHRLTIHWHWYDVLMLLVLVLGSNFVYGGIYVLISSIGFWTDSKTGIIPMIYNISTYGRYPVNIYNRAIRTLLTWVLPFAFVGVYPAEYFLRKEGWQLWAALTPVVGFILMCVGIWVWNQGIKKYRGAGS